MRPIGFSTGALAKGDFHRALNLLGDQRLDAVELSALRTSELEPLVRAASGLDLSGYRHVSVHAPGSFEAAEEEGIAEKLHTLAERGWPIVLHPDTIRSFGCWSAFGEMLYVENMDKRKPIGRTVVELERIFASLPDARLCFDIAHARQYDSSMTEAYRILKAFGSRVAQIHISEVNTASRHDRITPAAIRAFQEVAGFLPDDVPVIIETPVTPEEIGREVESAIVALTSPALLIV